MGPTTVCNGELVILHRQGLRGVMLAQLTELVARLEAILDDAHDAG